MLSTPSLRALSSEGVLSLKPDAVVYTSDAGPASVLSVLERSGVPMVELDSRRGLDGLFARIDQLGQLLHRESAATTLLDELTSQKRALASHLADMGQTPRALFLLTHGGRTPQVAGAGTTADAVLALAGLENVAADSVKGYKPLSVEAMAQLGHTVVVVLHDMNLALRYADDATLLCRGEVLEQGKAVDVMTPECIGAAYGVTADRHWSAGLGCWQVTPVEPISHNVGYDTIGI